MTSKKGLSGARIVTYNSHVAKVDAKHHDRIIGQGEWLELNGRSGKELHLPHVLGMLPDGYLMERLTPLPTSEVSLLKVVDALRTAVWRHAPRHLVDAPRTMLKVGRILDAHAPELLGEAVEQLAFIRTTVDCQAHGDPTAENVMLRGSNYVLIDPLPSTEEVPDDMAVDIGKLLQSAHGWEEMKGEERSSWTPDDVAKLFTTDLFRVGQLWCIVHFARTLPYARQEVKDRVIDKLTELLGVRR